MRKLTLLATMAIALVLLAGCDSSSAKYQQAINDLDKGNYETAIAAFEELGSYEQSKNYVTYAKAKEACDDKDWETAIELFTSIKGSLDVDDAFIANVKLDYVKNAKKMPIKTAVATLEECKSYLGDDQALLDTCKRIAGCMGSYYSPDYDPNKQYHGTTELELDFYLSDGTPYLVGGGTGIPFKFNDAPVLDGIDGYEFTVYTESTNGDAVFCFSSNAAKVNAGGLTRTLEYSK